MTVAENSPPAAHQGMHYLRAYTFWFSTPHWFETTLLLSLLFLMPVYGQLVVWGYCYHLVEHLLSNTEATSPPYRGSGVNWYIARSAWSSVLMMLLYIAGGAFLFFTASSTLIISIAATFGDADSQAAVFGVLFPLSAILIVLSLLMGSGVLLAATLRMALTQNFWEGFRITWLIDFIRKMWFEIALSSCFLWVTFFLITLLGSLFFCIGLLPAMVVCFIAQSHIQFQLYRMYVRRGGEPIRIQKLPDYRDQYY